MKYALPLIFAAAPALAEDSRQLDAHEHGVGELNIAVDGEAVAMEFHAPGADIVGFEYEAKSDADLAAIEAAITTLSNPLDLFVLPAAAECTVNEALASLETEHEDHHDDGEHDHDDHDEHSDDKHDDHDHADHEEDKHDDHEHDDHAEDKHDEHDHDDHAEDKHEEHDHDEHAEDKHDEHDHDDHAEDKHDEHDHDDHAEDKHDDHDHDDHAEEEGGHTEFHAEYTLTCGNTSAISQIEFAYFEMFENALEVEVQIITNAGAQAFEVERDEPVLDVSSMF